MNGFAALLLAVAIGQAAPAPLKVPDLRCGSYCAYVALKGLGLAPATFEAFEMALGKPGPQGYSLLELERAAQRQGAATKAVETSIDHLRWRREPFTCLTLLDDNHFVLVYDIDDSNVAIVDPPNVYNLPIDTFRTNWSRKCLLISKSPLVPEDRLRAPWGWGRILALGAGLPVALISGLLVARRLAGRRGGAARAGAALLVALGLAAGGCADRAPAVVPAAPAAPARAPELLVSPAYHRLGDLFATDPTATHDVRTTLTNAGDSPITVVELRKTGGCSCTKLEIDRSVIPPHSSATVTARVKLGDAAGPRRAAFEIVTEGPSAPVSTVTIDWLVVRPVEVEPVSLYLGRVAPRVASDFQGLTISARDGALCRDCVVTAVSGDPLLDCRLDLGADGRSPNHETGPGPSEPRPVGELRVRFQGSPETQRLYQKVTLAVDCRGSQRLRIEVPVTCDVRGDVTVVPERLSLGSPVAGETVSMSLMVHAIGSPPRILTVECDDEGVLSGVRYPNRAAAVQVLRLEFRVPRAAGAWRSSLRIRTDRKGFEELTVPVSALVKTRRA